MNRRPRPDVPAHYELRVEGHLDTYWSAWFGGMALSHEDDGTTTLRGSVTDQAALHGLLARVRDIGATLISVKSTDPADVRQGRRVSTGSTVMPDPSQSPRDATG